MLLGDGDRLWITDLRRWQPLRSVGGAGVTLYDKGTSADLRWLVAKRGDESLLIDTTQSKVVPLNGTGIKSVEWSDDGRWLLLDQTVLVDLTAATTHPIAYAEGGSILLGRGRPPLMVATDGDSLHLRQPSGPWVKVPATLKGLQWDRPGRWLAIGDADQVWLTQPSAAATAKEIGALLGAAMKQAPLPQPAEVDARRKIENLFPFPDEGWGIATVENHLLVWHRGVSGAWEQPTVFTNDELRQKPVSNVRLRA